MEVSANVQGINGTFGRDEFIWSDEAAAQLSWAPSFSFASSDLIDLNLKKSGVILTETHGREGGAEALTSL